MGNLNYKEESRKDWSRISPDGVKMSEDGIQLGAILRIADATEAMAKNHTELLAENARLKNSNQWLREENKKLINSITGYKGAITKLKNKINQQ